MNYRDFFLEVKILSLLSHIRVQAFNTIKKAFDDEHFSFKVIKSVGTVLLPGFIDIVIQRKSNLSHSYSP